MTKQQNSKISILCVNYNGGKELLDFLKSTQKVNYEKDKLQIIVLDNNSHDGSQNYVQKFKNANLIRLKKNYGYGPAANIGIKKAQGKYILIANNDLELEPNSLNILLKYILSHKDVAIAGGKILSKGKKHKPTSTLQKFNYLTGQVKMNSKQITKPTEVQWVQGCAMFTPKRLLKEIGNFDSGFEKVYFEDLDLCRRAQLKGFKTVIVPEAIFYHRQSYTLDNVLDRKVKWFNWHKNKIRFAIKHAAFYQTISILLFEAASSIFQTIFKKQPHIGPFLNALVVNFKGLGEIREKRAKLYG